MSRNLYLETMRKSIGFVVYSSQPAQIHFEKRQEHWSGKPGWYHIAKVRYEAADYPFPPRSSSRFFTFTLLSLKNRTRSANWIASVLLWVTCRMVTPV